MQVEITHNLIQKENTRFTLTGYINRKIKQEKVNAIGITIMLIMFGTGIASLTAAFAVNGEVSLPILMTSTLLAMGANAIAISQQPFKIIVWAFIVNILINSLLLAYQVIALFI
jgi:hypothetical protein